MFARCWFVALPLLMVALPSQAQLLRPTRRPGLYNPIASQLSNVLSGPRRGEHSCQGEGGASGSCVSRLTCRMRSGQAIGLCPGVLKVCCQETRTCDEDAVRNNTYFRSSTASLEQLQLGGQQVGGQQVGGQRAGGQTCRLRVHKLPGVCQLRLDFIQFSLRGPNSKSGLCDSDSLAVDGKDSNSLLPQICGENEGQHVYVDVATVRGPVSLLLHTSDKATDVGSHYRRWNIKVSQIPCDSPLRAPQGCLQYFTGSSLNHRLRSFNYDNNRPNELTYPSGSNYAICIRKELGMCRASFSSQGKFGLAADENGQRDTNCPKDYLLVGDKKYCGGTSLPLIDPAAPATDDPTPRTQGSGPMMMTVVTGTGDPTGNFPGFDVRYRQETC